jgi:hypothetical protein
MSTFFSRGWKGFWVSHVTVLAKERFPSGSAGMLILAIFDGTPQMQLFVSTVSPKDSVCRSWTSSMSHSIVLRGAQWSVIGWTLITAMRAVAGNRLHLLTIH